MTPHEIDLRREYEYETGIEFITVTGANTKKYVRWLENRLLSSSSNSDYAKCPNCNSTDIWIGIGNKTNLCDKCNNEWKANNINQETK